jgi:hypothetical protein
MVKEAACGGGGDGMIVVWNEGREPMMQRDVYGGTFVRVRPKYEEDG